jgi:hypothetical protein
MSAMLRGKNIVRNRAIAILLACMSTAFAGCGSPGLGETCDKAGSTDACEDGLVCTNESDRNTCQQLCTDQAQCTAGLSCNGVSGTNLKSCQPDKK